MKNTHSKTTGKANKTTANKIHAAGFALDDFYAKNSGMTYHVMPDGTVSMAKPSHKNSGWSF